MTVLTARFWDKVTEQHSCWQWTGAVGNTGYGQWAVNGTAKSVHRLAWAEFRGDIPTGLTVDHLCQNKRCVNPWHMELVTNAVNNQRRRTHHNACLLPVGATAAWCSTESLNEARRRKSEAEHADWFRARLNELDAFLALPEEERTRRLEEAGNPRFGFFDLPTERRTTT